MEIRIALLSDYQCINLMALSLKYLLNIKIIQHEKVNYYKYVFYFVMFR